MHHSEAGKGSSPRKNQDQKKYEENYSKIFGDNGFLARKRKEEEKNDSNSKTREQ